MGFEKLRRPSEVYVHQIPLSEHLASGRALCLSGENLSHTTLAGACLEDAVLSEATLTGAVFDRASLRKANLSRATLQFASFREADLTVACLRGANLENADLQNATLVDADFSDFADGQSSAIRTRLRGTNFGGADLEGAIMPPGYSFPLIDAAKDASAECSKVFLLLLAALVHAALTLAATVDAMLLPESSTFPLPVVQTTMPVLLFYSIAPLLLLLVFVYLQVCVDRLSRRVRTLPARLPDGVSPFDRLPLSLVTFLVWPHQRSDSHATDVMRRLARRISGAAVQFGAPLVVGLFWLRYLPRHDLRLSAWHSLLFAVSIGAALFFSGNRRALFGERPIIAPFHRAGVIAAVTFAVTLAISLAAAHSDLPAHFRWLAADITRQDVSAKPERWDGKDNSTIRGARLRELNLRYMQAPFAFLTKADLESANLFRANLRDAELSESVLTQAELAQADLRGAVLIGASLDHANLRGADLRGADLRIADLFRVELDQADLRGANLQDAQFLRPEQLSRAVTDGGTIMPNGTRGPFVTGKGMEQAKDAVPLEQSIHSSEAQ